MCKQNKWIQVDYPGWERINFYLMKWVYDQPTIGIDERDLIRDEDGTWLITNNNGGFDAYNEESDVDLEELYQDWVAEQVEDILLAEEEMFIAFV